MQGIDEATTQMKDINGYIACGIVDSDSGMAIAAHSQSSEFNIDAACAANTDVVRAKLRAMQALDLDTNLDDILITLGSQYHLIRPLASKPEVFCYLAIDRSRANLALARMSLAKIEQTLEV